MSKSVATGAAPARQAEEVKRQVKEASALIRAAERALIRHAKRTRTIFIGRGEGDVVKAASDE